MKFQWIVKKEYAALLIAMLGALVYINTLNSSFIGDDLGRILNQKSLFEKGLSAVIEILPDRPILMLSLWLNYITTGFDVFYFKLTNFLIHLAAGLCIYFILKGILSEQNELHADLVSFFSSLFFVLHPINNTIVNSIIQRGTSLALLFSLLSFIYLKKHLNKQNEYGYYVLSLLLFVCGILSKPNSMTLPILILPYLRFLKSFAWREAIKKTAPYFLISLMPIVYYFYSQVNTQNIAISSSDYLSVQTKVILLYFLKYFLPFDFAFYHPIQNDVERLLSQLYWPYVVVQTIIVSSLIYGILVKKVKWFFWALAAYLCFLPESGFFPIIHVFFYHRNYFSSPFVFVFLVLAITKFKFKENIKLSALVLLTMYFGYFNYDLNRKTNTYEKWIFYNLNINAHNKFFNISSLGQAVWSDNADLANNIYNFLNSKGAISEELIDMKNYIDFEKQDVETKKKIISSTYKKVLNSPASSGYFYFVHDVLQKNLKGLYDQKKASHAMNSFYFTYLDYIFNVLKNIEIEKQVFYNFIQIINESKNPMAAADSDQKNKTSAENLEIERMLYLRSLAALRFYFQYNSNENIEKIKTEIQSKFAHFPESKTLLIWLK